MFPTEMPSKNDDRLTIRLPAELRATLNEIEKNHRIGEAEIARGCLEAVAEFYREHGYFAFPVKIQPGDIWTEIHRKTSANLAGLEKAAETARAKATGKKAS